MVKIEDGKASVNLVDMIGKKISINKYLQPDSKVDGFRFGTIERIGKSKKGFYLVISYNEDCHHEGKRVSAYSLRHIEDAIVHN